MFDADSLTRPVALFPPVFDTGEPGDNAVAFPITRFGSYLVALERAR